MNRTETILNKRVNISRLSTLLDYVDYRLFSECDDKRKLTMDHIYRQHVCKIMMILDNSNLNQRGRYNRTIRRKTYNIKIHGSFINNRSIYFCESRICYIALQCQSLKNKYPALRKPNVGLMHIAVFFLVFQTHFDRHCSTSYANNIIPTRKASTPQKKSLKIPKRQPETTNWRTHNTIDKTKRTKRKTINDPQYNEEWAHVFIESDIRINIRFD